MAKTMLDFDLVWFDLHVFVNQAFQKLSLGHFYNKKNTKFQGLETIKAFISKAHSMHRPLIPNKSSYKECTLDFLKIFFWFHVSPPTRLPNDLIL